MDDIYTFESDIYTFESDEVKNMKDSLENQDLTSVVGKIQDYFKELDNEPLNIAVTGESGSGKSTFINAFRGMGHEEDGSASTGVVETTLEPKEYPHPKYPNVKLWDLPGIGTPMFKADQYLKAVTFERYDFFIIVTSDRFRECHVQLASEIQKMDKSFYFLRNKIDTSIAAEKTSKPKTFIKEKTLEAIRKDCIKGLQKINVAAALHVFLISCFDLGDYDFNRLLNAIEKELPKQKRHVLLLALPNITMEINRKKMTALRADIWKVALLSSVVDTVPLTGLVFNVDVRILQKEIEKYYAAFGLDDKGLQQIAMTSNVSVKELKAEMKYTPDMNLSSTGVIARLKAYGSDAPRCTKNIFSLIPILGPIVAGGISFITTRHVLNKSLDDMATDAHNVLKKAVSTTK